jgi:hypothetical protein
MNAYAVTNGNQKVSLMCPEGHPMFETGILVKTLYKNHGIRLTSNQLVQAGYDWSKMEAALIRMGVSPQAAKDVSGRSKLLALCPVYQLSQFQCEQMTRVKCNTCHPRKSE